MGVMLYLLLTGTYPFEDRQRPGNVTATLRRVREGKINPFPDRVCPYAQQLVRHMIRVDPRRRVCSAPRFQSEKRRVLIGTRKVSVGRDVYIRDWYYVNREE